jgi:hypothetical protein
MDLGVGIGVVRVRRNVQAEAIQGRAPSAGSKPVTALPLAPRARQQDQLLLLKTPRPAARAAPGPSQCHYIGMAS